ncbi:hypothetical protein MUK42_35874 [Musa troglodytarum]|uniref:Uncharacterized protein n=1 Tax=Musa troglodytarum TaxID=320322 RepID=A0A9E7E7B5_9LILI|nr:hypothetical protein MUK42_35874 [Musa troglodytarum]
MTMKYYCFDQYYYYFAWSPQRSYSSSSSHQLSKNPSIGTLGTDGDQLRPILFCSAADILVANSIGRNREVPQAYKGTTRGTTLSSPLQKA